MITYFKITKEDIFEKKKKLPLFIYNMVSLPKVHVSYSSARFLYSKNLKIVTPALLLV